MTAIKILIEPYLKLLTERKMTNKAVAVELCCRPETISRALKALGIQKSPAKGSAQAKAERRTHIEQSKLAITAAAKDKSLSLAEAAEACGCSIRTIQRHRRSR